MQGVESSARGAVQARACQPRVVSCTRAAASARRSSPAAAKIPCSSGSDSDEMGSPCTPAGRFPAMKRGAGTDGIVMSARRLDSMTPLLPPAAFALGFAFGRSDGNDVTTDSRDSRATMLVASGVLLSSSGLSSALSGVRGGNFAFRSTRPCSAWSGSSRSDGCSPK
jgi:hypothetical protein